MKFCKQRSLIRVRKKDKTGNDHWLPAEVSQSDLPPFLYHILQMSDVLVAMYIFYSVSLSQHRQKKLGKGHEWKLTHKLLSGEIVTVKKNKAYSQPCIKSAVKVTMQLVCMC